MKLYMHPDLQAQATMACDTHIALSYFFFFFFFLFLFFWQYSFMKHNLEHSLGYWLVRFHSNQSQINDKRKRNKCHGVFLFCICNLLTMKLCSIFCLYCHFHDSQLINAALWWLWNPKMQYDDSESKKIASNLERV